MEPNSSPKPPHKLGMAIIALLPLVLFLRGLYSVVTQEYLGTIKYGGAIELHGTPAVLVGFANICMAGMIGAGIYYQYTPYKNRALVIGALMLAGSICCYVLSLHY